MSTVRDRDVFTYKNYVFFWKPSKLDLTSFLLVKYVANFTGDFIKKKEPLNLEGENRNVGFL